MKHFRMCKYRAGDVSEDWTSITDVGKRFGETVLTLADYLDVENCYLLAIGNFLDFVKIDTMKVVLYEDFRGTVEISPQRVAGITDPYLRIRGGDVLKKPETLEVCKLCLRDLMWVRLVAERGEYISFGDDLYVHIGCQFDLVSKETHICPPGIYLYPAEDPFA